MDATRLRALQAPLKAKYNADPAAARITLRARGSTDQSGISCKLETARAIAVAGLHPATGGTGLELCSGDLLLEALVACAGVTLKAVATALHVPLVHADITAEGDLDFRGTLGVDKAASVGFEAIRLQFDVQSNASEDALRDVLRLTERYCVVLQTLTKGVPVSTGLART
ncbi:MAG: OsmC family protein [Hyphomicrobium sp.]|nr:OsmC family protein [Hyphomicrobium sp.]